METTPSFGKTRGELVEAGKTRESKSVEMQEKAIILQK